MGLDLTLMWRWCRGILLCSLLLLGACSGSNFVYNQLDFILPWYVDDYAELNTKQDAYLEEGVAADPDGSSRVRESACCPYDVEPYHDPHRVNRLFDQGQLSWDLSASDSGRTAILLI